MVDITRVYKGYTIAGAVVLDAQDQLKIDLRVMESGSATAVLRGTMISAASLAEAVTVAKGIIDDHIDAVVSLTTEINS